MKINITPIPAFPAEATQLLVDDGYINLGYGANFQYVLLDANNSIVCPPARVDLTQMQYDQWTGDDVFVCLCVSENLGIEPLQVP